jgi:hypothetical protein
MVQKLFKVRNKNGITFKK